MSDAPSQKIYAIEIKVVKKLRKSCLNMRDHMDYILSNHYEKISDLSMQNLCLVCEVLSLNCKLITSLDNVLRDCPEISNEETNKKELILSDIQLMMIETTMMARSELSKILLTSGNISTHSH